MTDSAVINVISIFSPPCFTANVDYEQIPEPVILTFTENVQFICVNISILPDDTVESTEMFSVLLNSNDTVSFNRSSAVVFIMDSDRGGFA